MKNNPQIVLENLAFDEPRLEFSSFIRSLVRIVSYSYYALLTAAAAVAFFSDINWLKWLGALYLIFLADLLLNARKAEHSLFELSHLPAASLTGVNAAAYFTPESWGLLEEAADKAAIFGNGFRLNLLKLLAKEKEVRGALWRLNVSPEEFEQKTDEELEKFDAGGLGKSGVAEEAARFGKEAFLFAFLSGSRFVEPIDLFGALGQAGAQEEDKSVYKIMYLFGVQAADLKGVLVFGRWRKKYLRKNLLPEALGGFAQKAYRPGRRAWNWAWFGRFSPVLDKYGRDLTDSARAGEIGLLLGHRPEYQKLVEIVLRPEKNSAFLVGPEHSGRSALVYHLAFEIAKNRQPLLADCEIIELSAEKLAAQPDALSLVEKMVEEADRAGNLLIYFPDLGRLVQNRPLAEIFLSAALAGKIQLVAALEKKETERFSAGVEAIEMSPLAEEEVIKLLSYESVILEARFKVLIFFAAVKRAAVLGGRLGPLPYWGQEILKEAAASAAEAGGRQVGEDEITAAFEKLAAVKKARAEV